MEHMPIRSEKSFSPLSFPKSFTENIRPNADAPFLTKETSVELCQQELVVPGGRKAYAVFSDYEKKQSTEPKSYWFMDHSFLLGEVKLDDIIKVSKETPPILKGLRSYQFKKKQALYSNVEDLYTVRPVVSVFHQMMESKHVVPTWLNFETVFYNTRTDLFWDEIQRKCNFTSLSPADKRFIVDAVTWRFGLMYFSFLREIHLITALRELHGIDVKYNIVADVIMKVDFWFENRAFSMFVNNQRYRTAESGRKKSASSIFGCPDSNIMTTDIVLLSTRKTDEVFLLSSDHIADIALMIKTRDYRKSYSVE